MWREADDCSTALVKSAFAGKQTVLHRRCRAQHKTFSLKYMPMHTKVHVQKHTH